MSRCLTSTGVEIRIGRPLLSRRGLSAFGFQRQSSDVWRGSSSSGGIRGLVGYALPACSGQNNRRENVELIKLHAQSRISHLCTGQFWIDGFYDLGMLQLSVVEQLVNILEYPARTSTIRAEYRVCGWSISRLCLRPQRGHEFGVYVDIAGHGGSRELCGTENPGNGE